MKIEELPSEVQLELTEELTQNILERYDNEEYWDERIIERYLKENKDK